VSVGSAIAQAALATTRRVALELLELGTYDALGDCLPFSDVNSMFAQASSADSSHA
jgi:hypothetical protein